MCLMIFQDNSDKLFVHVRYFFFPFRWLEKYVVFMDLFIFLFAIRSL